MTTPEEPQPEEQSSAEADAAAEQRGVDLRRATEVTRPRTLGGMVYLAVLGGALVGVVIAALGPWRSGVSVLALSMIAGAGARLLIPDANSGMLKVRNRYLDASVLTGLGATLLFLALTIPDQH